MRSTSLALIASACLPARRLLAHPLCLLDEGSNVLTVLGGTLARLSETQEDTSTGWMQQGSSWLLLPPSVPWAVVHFVGGAGFGANPRLCYGELLSCISRRLGVAVITTPYQLSTDHDTLSRAVHGDFCDALAACHDACTIPSTAPIYRIGHSLGAKLLVIGALQRPVLPSTAKPMSEEGDGGKASLGLLAFNNFGIEDSAALAADVLADLQGGERGEATARAVLDVFSTVQQFASAAGVGPSLEVTPTPLELEAAVSRRYAAPQTSLWRFEDDTLDSTERLLEVLPADAPRSFLELRGLRGHLTPVCFRLSASDIDPSLALLLGSSRGLSFGSREAVEELANNICDWIWPSGMSAPTVANVLPASNSAQDTAMDAA